MHAWASGDALADVLDEDDELTGGDFVRHVKQVVDLLHQIAVAAPGRRDPRRPPARPPTPASAGVVAASSVLRVIAEPAA